MAETTKSNPKGVFINLNERPDLPQLIADLKAKTGIKFTTELFYQAIRRWAAQTKNKKSIEL